MPSASRSCQWHQKVAEGIPFLVLCVSYRFFWHHPLQTMHQFRLLLPVDQFANAPSFDGIGHCGLAYFLRNRSSFCEFCFFCDGIPSKYAIGPAPICPLVDTAYATATPPLPDGTPDRRILLPSNIIRTISGDFLLSNFWFFNWDFIRIKIQNLI